VDCPERKSLHDARQNDHAYFVLFYVAFGTFCEAIRRQSLSGDGPGLANRASFLRNKAFTPV
jgi:hypothetical protein